MKSLGGYFELELNDKGSIYHDSLIKLNTGRNALEFILNQKKYNKVYLPYYSCDVLLQPINRLNLKFEFYHINKVLEPLLPLSIEEDSVFILINYFGLLDKVVEKYSNKRINIIVDNSQSFYSLPLKGISTFYSPRKFFGLPDGGLASVNDIEDIFLEKDVSITRVSHLIKRLDLDAESGFKDFQENDKVLNGLPIKEMSNFTEKVLRGIDFDKVKAIRIDNFKRMHSKLKHLNLLSDLIEKSSFETPMIYPFLRKNNLNLRHYLNKKGIYNAAYWPNVESAVKKKDYEYFLFQNLVALPIDQRVTFDDIDRIINEIDFFIDG